MFGYANWYAYDGYREFLFFLPTQQVLLLGPVLYFYTQSLLNPGFRLKKKDYLHFLPAGVYLGYSLLIFLVDVFFVEEYYFYSDGRDKDLSLWYQVAGWLSMFIYLILSLRYYQLYKKLIYQVTSNAESLLFRWIQRYLLVFLFILSLRFLFWLIAPEWGDFGNKYWYYLLFSIALLYIALQGYATIVRASVPFDLNLFSKDAVYLIKSPATQLREHIPLEQKQPKQEEVFPDLEQWKTTLQDAMKNQQLYKNPKLTLSQVAESLETNSKTISRIVNLGFDKNFNDYINDFRILAILRQFEQDSHQQKTLLAIALEAGFNSKATFNRAFKKHTGSTPKRYLEQFQGK